MNFSIKRFSSAVETVLYIARNAGVIPVRSGNISEYQGVSLRYLENILQDLVHSGILKSIRGPKGGYLLAKDRRKITLRDIYDSVLDKSKNRDNFSELNNNIIQPILSDIENNIRNNIDSISIQELCDMAIKFGIENSDNKADFNI